MARTAATFSFQAIELKGSLLPGSLLEQVARLKAPMQKEADYGLPKGERLRERDSPEHRGPACLRAHPARCAGLAGLAALWRLATRRRPLPDHPPGV